MGNVINRNTVFMECMSLVDNNVFASGEMVSVYKIENILEFLHLLLEMKNLQR